MREYPCRRARQLAAAAGPARTRGRQTTRYVYVFTPRAHLSHSLQTSGIYYAKNYGMVVLGVAGKRK